MIINLLKISIRNFKRQLGFSLINILGLTIGIAISIVGFLYVSYELSYDRYNSNADRIHRISVNALTGTTEIYSTVTAAAYTDFLYDDFPEIENICRISRQDFEFEFQNKKFIESDVFVVDSTFFNIFTIPVIQGETKNLLNDPNCVVLTESTAKKYFGNSNPINQIIKEDSISYKVIAIVEDVPENSHFHFNIAVSLMSYERYYNNHNMWDGNVLTYIMLHKNIDYKEFEVKFPEFVNNRIYKGNYNQTVANGNRWELFLQPLPSIHLHSDLRSELEANGRIEYVIIVLLISIFILIVACINYINLTTAKATSRAKEVGIRKVIGLKKKQLILHFLLESLIFSSISLILAMMLVELSKPLFNQILKKSLVISYTDPYFLLGLIGIILFTAIIGGAYPAVLMSSFNPISTLKNSKLKIGKSSLYRNVLVVFQFMISVILIIGTLIITSQLNLLQNKNLGFDKDNVIIIRNASVIKNSIQAIKNDITSLTFVQDVAHSNRLPGISLNIWGCAIEGKDTHALFNVFYSDEDLNDVLKLELTKGRYFSKEYGTDTLAVVINEEAEKLIDFDEILGKRFTFGGVPPIYVHIIGVVKNFCYESKHQKVHPIAILNINNIEGNPASYLSVSVNPGNYNYMIKELMKVWDKYSTGVAMDYAFLDEQYDSLYESEMQTQKLFLVISFLAIFIACLGLLGLAFYLAQQKIKEIGIRKVFGASEFSIILLLSNEISKLIIIANIIACPIAWYLFDNWLNNFNERCELHWWYFALASLISFLIAYVTISFQTIKVSRENPISALKYE